MATSGAESLVGVPEGGVGEDGGGVGGVWGCGVSGIEFSQFEGEIGRQGSDLLDRETDPALKHVCIMGESTEDRLEIVLIQAFHCQRVVFVGGTLGPSLDLLQLVPRQAQWEGHLRAVAAVQPVRVAAPLDP